MQGLARSSGLPGIALASASMIVFAQFPPPQIQTPLVSGADIAVRLVAVPAPIDAPAPLDLGTGFVDVAGPIQGSVAAGDLLPGMNDAAFDDLLAMPAAAFNPIGLLLLPLFPLALIPLFFTFAGSLLAFLMYQFSPLPGMADAVAVNPALDGPLADAGSLLNGLDFNTVFSSVGDSGSLAPEALADLALAF